MTLLCFAANHITIVQKVSTGQSCFIGVITNASGHAPIAADKPSVLLQSTELVIQLCGNLKMSTVLCGNALPCETDLNEHARDMRPETSCMTYR